MEREKSGTVRGETARLLRLNQWRGRLQGQTQAAVGGTELHPTSRRTAALRRSSPSVASSVLLAAPSAPSCSLAGTTSSAPAHLFSACKTHSDSVRVQTKKQVKDFLEEIKLLQTT